VISDRANRAARRARGLDPIARWLGDDRDPPPEGAYRYANSAAFLRELDAVLSPTDAFEYDGRYARRYDPRRNEPTVIVHDAIDVEFEVELWHGLRDVTLGDEYRRFVAEFTRARERAVRNVNVTLVSSFATFGDRVRYVSAEIERLSRAVRDAAAPDDALARWADDGGAVGLVDY